MKRLLAYLFIVLGLGLVFNTPSFTIEKILPEGSPQNQYDFVTEFLKVGDYNNAEKGFKEFIETNPNHELASNSQYWLAETFRVRQLYDKALKEYLIGHYKYPNGEKSSINIIKLATALIQIGKKEIGCSILADYKKLYPSASNSRKKKRNEEYKRLDCNKINYIANWKNELQVFEKTQIAKKEPSQTQEVAKKVSLKNSLTLSEEDALKGQIFGCWSIPLGLPYNEDLKVRIKLKLKRDGSVLRTEILDLERMNKPGQGFYKVLAESALRAIKLCQPLRVPTTGYERWKDLVLHFDAREMLGMPSSTDTQIAKTEPSQTQRVAKSALTNCKGSNSSKWTNCQGTETYAGGSKYVGEWKDGNKHGQGTQTWLDGEKYVGRWYEDKKTKGTETFSNGDKYVGTYLYNRIYGLGTYIWSDGRSYVGYFKLGKQHDEEGTYIDVDGKKYVGEFKDGKYEGRCIKGDCNNGQGSKTWFAEERYVGEFKDGKKDGLGNYICTSYNKRWYSKRDLGILDCKPGRIIKGIWVNDLLKDIININF